MCATTVFFSYVGMRPSRQKLIIILSIVANTAAISTWNQIGSVVKWLSSHWWDQTADHRDKASALLCTSGKNLKYMYRSASAISRCFDVTYSWLISRDTSGGVIIVKVQLWRWYFTRKLQEVEEEEPQMSKKGISSSKEGKTCAIHTNCFISHCCLTNGSRIKRSDSNRRYITHTADVTPFYRLLPNSTIGKDSYQIGRNFECEIGRSIDRGLVLHTIFPLIVRNLLF